MLLVATLIAMGLRRDSPVSLWDAWDSSWYQGIARYGYQWSIHGKPAAAFFPLEPLLIHVLWRAGLPTALAGVLISNVAFIAALFYVYALAREEWGDRAAKASLGLIALFPTAFVTSGAYTESILVLSAAAALYHARRGDTLVAGLWVAAAVLVRPTGAILLPAVLLAAGGASPRRWLALLGPSIAGVASYGVYLQANGIPVSLVLTAQRSWHRSLTPPWEGFRSSIAWLLAHGSGNLPWAAENLLGLTVTVAFLGLTWAAWRELSPPAAVYVLGFWLLVLCTPAWLDGYYAPFTSMDRFVLALFPLAPWAAVRLSPVALRRLTWGMGALFLIGAVAHLAGGWVG